jgi:hypothetical protein
MNQYGSHEHIANIYKVYAPYIVKNKYNKLEKKLKDKYYDIYNIYKPKKQTIENNKVIPNRRLSPIRSNIINI